jgi:hypothetical protein
MKVIFTLELHKDLILYSGRIVLLTGITRQNFLFLQKVICNYSMVIALFLHQNTKMQFKFTKNIQFTKLIKANGRLKEFNFRKLNDHKEGMFTVDVVDERDSRVFFNIQKIDNSWKIVKQALPQWVLENEQIFHEVIEEELKLT